MLLGFYTVGICVCLALLIALAARGLYSNVIMVLIFLLGSLACQFYGI
jgi:hypothetical protein